MSDYEQLKKILSKAEEFEEIEPVYWDGENLLDQWGYLCHHPFCKSKINGWRKISDIKEIVDLMESRDQLVQDLNDIYFSPPSGAFPRTDSDFKRVGQDLLNLINKLEK